MNPPIFQLRKTLHQYPELSGKEFNTAKKIQAFIQEHYPGKLINTIGGPSFAVVYEFGSTGNTVAIRCELDALPITEKNNFEYSSKSKGVSHKCGHDGHMSIVSGLVFWLQKQNFKTGTVVFLFQSAEETGKGAYDMLQDTKFSTLNIDYLFALHNIPGIDLHTIISMDKGFSAEVESLVISLTGVTSHASEPENGINPSIALATLIKALDSYNNSDPFSNTFTVLTPVHIKMGEASYGISPGNGELHYTLRTWSTKQMELLKQRIEQLVTSTCSTHKLSYKLTWLEHFPASENNLICNTFVEEAALANNFKLLKRPYPFKFGEDFGWFSKSYKTAMFGLGAGINTPPLHNPTYDFPDEIITTGIQMFGSIITKALNYSS